MKNKHRPTNCYLRKLWRNNFLLALFLVLNSWSVPAQPLNGVYTIGGNSPDYPDFTSAVAALHVDHISGSVTFNVRPGTYIENIKILQIGGSSPSAVVTFQSETGNPDDVVLRHTHVSYSANYNFTISVYGGDNLVFRDMTIKADPSYPFDPNKNRVIYITNNSNNLSFINNKILSWYTTNDNQNNNCIDVVSGSQTTNSSDTIRFIGNTIVGGYMGLYFQGSTSAQNFLATGWAIKDNVFLDQHSTCLKILIGTNTTISGNKFYGISTSSSFHAIEINQNKDTLIIDRNYFELAHGGTGVYMWYVETGTANVKQITNNMMIIGPNSGNGISRGINSWQNEMVLVAHNSIHIYTSASTGYCIYSHDNNNLNLLNNQFVNSSGGLCYFIENNTTGLITSDYNNLYNGGNPIGSIEGVQYNTVLDLDTLLGLDVHSISVDPLFLSDTMLIPFDSLCFERGTPVPAVTLDYFGHARSATAPDIGIFEGNLSSIEAGLVNSSLFDYMPCPTDTVPFYVTLKNFGTQALTSANIIYGTPDTVFHQTNWTGNLLQFEEEDSIYAGTVSFGLWEQVVRKAWVANPNGQYDSIQNNDTIIVSAFASMTGDYSVGDTLSDFVTINDAVDALIMYGVCGPVNINIKPGTYTEQIIIPEITGASSFNTITFQSANFDSTSVILQCNSTNAVANYIIRLQGAKHILIKYLHIKTQSYIHEIGVYFIEGASNNTISNCLFTGTISSSTDKYFIHSKMWNGMLVDTTAILNNRFVLGDYPILVESFQTTPFGKLNIENNIFEGQLNNIIQIEGQSDLTIAGNNIEGNILIEDCVGPVVIENNKIVATAYSNVVSLDNCVGSINNPIEIKNNFISTSLNYGICLTLHSTSELRVVHNNLLAENGNLAFYLENYLTNVDIFNNVINCPSGGAFFYAPYSPSSCQYNSDYNAFYTISPIEFRYLNLDFVLSEWQSATANDLHSFYANPVYVSDTDLHINNSPVLDQAGTPLPYVLFDIDGEPRNLLGPDIGADEFDMDSTAYYDLQVSGILHPDTDSCIQPDSLVVEVVNHSAFPIDTFDVKWFLFHRLNDSTTFIQTIPAHDTAIVNLGPFTFSPNTWYDFEFEVSRPNGHIDNNFIDNSLGIQYYHLHDAEIFKKSNPACINDIELYIKDFPRETVQWSTSSSQSSIIVTNPGTYSVTVTDNKGCTVTDSIMIN